MVACALGRARSANLGDLAALRMGVRIDAPGHIESDYQTACEVAKADGSTPGTVLSRRHYLADARFLVALEGNASLLTEIQAALRQPRWPLFLGRKGYVPGEPVALRDGVHEGMELVQALAAIEWPYEARERAAALDAVIECRTGEPGDARLDVPLSFEVGARRYGERRVRRVRIGGAAVSP